ncbi:hypothetical protein C7449_101489 [Mycoplana dimorpha]|uniref:Uncharacterized protein n=1 Tax=Mycoplana dimorpha TaxID=28320 RepID=A0A2T5BIU3_MYCDI|nr:hypothetical protein C7449_101489 [Mycoplana dimorpha]
MPRSVRSDGLRATHEKRGHKAPFNVFKLLQAELQAMLQPTISVPENQ